MKPLITLALMSIALAGCSATARTKTPEYQNMVIQRYNFIDLVSYMRDAKNVNAATKNEVIRRIESTGFGYICEHDRCFMHRDQLKVQIQPDHIYIEYPDKSFKKVWNTYEAADMLFKLP